MPFFDVEIWKADVEIRKADVEIKKPPSGNTLGGVCGNIKKNILFLQDIYRTVVSFMCNIKHLDT